VHWYHAAPFLTAAAQSQHCVVEGVYSHFANADALDLSSAQAQLAHFQEALSLYEKNGLPCPTRHIANSGGILQLPKVTLIWFGRVF
jgi:alanine racemase